MRGKSLTNGNVNRLRGVQPPGVRGSKSTVMAAASACTLSAAARMGSLTSAGILYEEKLPDCTGTSARQVCSPAVTINNFGPGFVSGGIGTSAQPRWPSACTR